MKRKNNPNNKFKIVTNFKEHTLSEMTNSELRLQEANNLLAKWLVDEYLKRNRKDENKNN